MPVKIFFCYAREDEPLLNKLKSHLRPLQRQGFIDVWLDRNINAGTEWEREISEQLNAAEIILLLISPYFMDSDYCYGIEMKRAIEREERKEARVIPIILTPIYWQVEPLSKLQALPIDAKPVTGPDWHSQDEAFFSVAEGIRKIVKEQWINRGLNHYKAKHYEEALTNFEQLIRLDNKEFFAHYFKGVLLYELQRNEEALATFEQAIHLDFSIVGSHIYKGLILERLERDGEALATFDYYLKKYSDDRISLFKIRLSERLRARQLAADLRSARQQLANQVNEIQQIQLQLEKLDWLQLRQTILSLESNIYNHRNNLAAIRQEIDEANLEVQRLNTQYHEAQAKLNKKWMNRNQKELASFEADLANAGIIGGKNSISNLLIQQEKLETNLRNAQIEMQYLESRWREVEALTARLDSVHADKSKTEVHLREVQTQLLEVQDKLHGVEMHQAQELEIEWQEFYRMSYGG